MKRILLALILTLFPGFAWAQCTGVFPPATLCGNLSGSPAPPSAFATPGALSLGNPTGVVGLAVVNGAAASAMRSDGAPPLSASVQSALTSTNNQLLIGTGAFGFTSIVMGGDCTLHRQI